MCRTMTETIEKPNANSSTEGTRKKRLRKSFHYLWHCCFCRKRFRYERNHRKHEEMCSRTKTDWVPKIKTAEKLGKKTANKFKTSFSRKRTKKKRKQPFYCNFCNKIFLYEGAHFNHEVLCGIRKMTAKNVKCGIRKKTAKNVKIEECNGEYLRNYKTSVSWDSLHEKSETENETSALEQEGAVVERSTDQRSTSLEELKLKRNPGSLELAPGREESSRASLRRQNCSKEIGSSVCVEGGTKRTLEIKSVIRRCSMCRKLYYVIPENKSELSSSSYKCFKCSAELCSDVSSQESLHPHTSVDTEKSEKLCRKRTKTAMKCKLSSSQKWTRKRTWIKKRKRIRKPFERPFYCCFCNKTYFYEAVCLKHEKVCRTRTSIGVKEGSGEYLSGYTRNVSCNLSPEKAETEKEILAIKPKGIVVEKITDQRSTSLEELYEGYDMEFNSEQKTLFKGETDYQDEELELKENSGYLELVPRKQKCTRKRTWIKKRKRKRNRKPFERPFYCCFCNKIYLYETVCLKHEKVCRTRTNSTVKEGSGEYLSGYTRNVSCNLPPEKAETEKEILAIKPEGIVVEKITDQRSTSLEELYEGNDMEFHFEQKILFGGKTDYQDEELELKENSGYLELGPEREESNMASSGRENGSREIGAPPSLEEKNKRVIESKSVIKGCVRGQLNKILENESELSRNSCKCFVCNAELCSYVSSQESMNPRTSSNPEKSICGTLENGAERVLHETAEEQVHLVSGFTSTDMRFPSVFNSGNSSIWGVSSPVGSIFGPLQEKEIGSRNTVNVRLWKCRRFCDFRSGIITDKPYNVQELSSVCSAFWVSNSSLKLKKLFTGDLEKLQLIEDEKEITNYKNISLFPDNLNNKGSHSGVNIIPDLFEIKTVADWLTR